MKSKKKFSLVSIVLLVMIAIAAVYYFVFFVPGQTELQMIKADTMVYTAEASIYEAYINDPSELEADIRYRINSYNENGRFSIDSVCSEADTDDLPELTWEMVKKLIF